jgi:nitroreductase
MTTPAFQTINTVFDARHSCRAFLPDAVPRDVIEQIVATAQKVPSWCNCQPWQLIVTTPPQTQAVADLLYAASEDGMHAPDIEFPEKYNGIYRARRAECGYQLYDAVGIAKGDRAASTLQMRENYRLFGAPHLALITAPVEQGPYGMMDCGGFISAFTLVAQSLGVASIAQAALAGYAPLLRAHFDIPQDRHILCGISFGYADPAHPINQFRTSRADPDQVIDWR